MKSGLLLRCHQGAGLEESDRLIAAVSQTIETYFAFEIRASDPRYKSTHAFRRRRRRRLLAELDNTARERFLAVVGRAFDGHSIADTTALSRSSCFEASVIVRQSLDPKGPSERLNVYASVLGPYFYASLESLRLPDGTSIADEPDALQPHLAELENGFAELGIEPIGELALYRAFGVFPEFTNPDWVLVFHCLFNETIEAAMVYDAFVGGRTLQVKPDLESEMRS